MSVPVHIVAGFLGTGKTTAVRAWMAGHAERCAVIVNDFGEAGIDAAILGESGATVTSIPGGCVCCTAPEGLARALEAILDAVRPDRVFIEPSGLARPQDVVDMLARGALRGRVDRRPTIVLVDPARMAGELVDAQLEAADVLVANRCDLASPTELDAFRARAAALWPPPMAVVETTFGRLPEAALEGAPEGALEGERSRAGHPHRHASTEGFHARSWVFPADAAFAWDRLRALLEGTPSLARFKGMFSSDIGWLRVDAVAGRVQFGTTAYRRDSRADLIVTDAAALDAFAAGLEACRATAAEAPAGSLTVVGADGLELRLTREALAALPGQVPDVATRVPGRAGEGVYLRELLGLVSAGARCVVTAGDGMTAGPVDVDGVGDAILVHSLAGAELPAKQGGPLRLLAGTSTCANVKGVVRIRILAD